MKKKINYTSVSMVTVINRNFYNSLRKIGRTHYEIIRMIQSERLDQFIKDILPIHNVLDLKPLPCSTTTFWKKLINKFKLLFTISLLCMGLNSMGQDTIPSSKVVSVVSTQKDTLYLANNVVGYEIEDVWSTYPIELGEDDNYKKFLIGNKPVIIFKSPQWIIRENNIRKEEK